MVDGRNIFESELQGFVREVFEEGWEFGSDGLPSTECGYAESEEAHARHDKKLHELIVSYLDGPTSDVGTQDEAAEEEEMGDRVRSESHLIPGDSDEFVVNEWGLSNKITDEFAREMGLRFAQEGKKVAMGHCNLTKNPDGSIHAHINFFPQNPR